MKIACSSVSYETPPHTHTPLTLTLSLHKNETQFNWCCTNSRNRREHFPNHQGSEGTKTADPCIKNWLSLGAPSSGDFSFGEKIQFRDTNVKSITIPRLLWVFSQDCVSTKALHFPHSLEKVIRFLKLELL